MSRTLLERASRQLQRGRIVLQSGFTIDLEYASKLLIYICYGGRGEIRTHEGLAPLPVFKTGALNHSATLPIPRNQ